MNNSTEAEKLFLVYQQILDTKQNSALLKVTKLEDAILMSAV